MFSLLIFSSLFALTLAQQCPANPGGGPILYPALAAKNVSIGETPPKGVGIEGWLLVPSSLIDAVWGDAGYPYAVFDQSEPNAAAQFPSSHVPVIFTSVLGLFLAGILVTCCCGVCCCWVCCCCFEDGDDSSKDNSDHFACKLFCFIAVLVIVVMMLSLTLVGVIIGFVTNAGMSDAIGSFPSTANEAATAMRDFLDGMNEDVTMVIEGGFDITVDCLQSRTSALNGTFRATLGNNSNFISALDAATTNVGTLNTQLSDIQNSLNMTNTSVEAVKELQTNISSLCSMNMICNASSVMAAVTNLDMVASTADQLQTIVSTMLTAEEVQSELMQLDAGLMEFSNGVGASLQSTMSDITTNLRDDIAGAVEQFSTGIMLVNSVLDSFVTTTSDLQTEPLDPTQPVLTYTTVRDLWYWLAIIFCVMVLFAIFLISLGLVVGGIPYSCPRVPKRKRVSNIGSRLLMVSLGTSILTGALLLIMAALCFYLGASGQELCEPLTSDERFAATLDNDQWRRSVLRIIVERALAFNESESLTTLLTQATDGISFAQGLRACQANQSLWTAFQLDQLLAAQAALPSAGSSFRSFNLTSLLERFTDAINTATLNADTMSALTAVSSNISGYNAVFSVINLESISSYVNQSMEAVTSAMNAFSSLAMFLQTIMGNDTTVDSLLADVEASLGHLGNISNSLGAIEASRMEVQAIAEMLNSSLAQLQLEVPAVSMALGNSSSPLYQAVTSDVQAIVNGTLDYSNYVLESLRGDVGRCFPFWAGYNNIRNNVCLDLVNYLNGYWYSLGWSALWLVLLFIPVVILAVMFRNPLERPLSMKDRSKMSSRGIELLNVTNRENGWAWKRSSEYARDRSLVGASRPLSQPLLSDNLPFERTASPAYPISTQSTLTKPQETAFERTNSYSKSTLSSQEAIEPGFLRSQATTVMSHRPLPHLPPPEDEVYTEIDESPQTVSQVTGPPADVPAKTVKGDGPSLDNAAAATPSSTEAKTETLTIENPHASEGEGSFESSPKEGTETTVPLAEGAVEEEEVTGSEPHKEQSTTETEQETNEDEEEESAPLLQKKSSERIKQSMEENTVEERGSTENETETIENPHASEDEERYESSPKEGTETTVPLAEGAVEEEEVTGSEPHKEQSTTETEQETSTENETETIDSPHASEDEERFESSPKEGTETTVPQAEGAVEEEDEYVIVSLQEAQISAEGKDEITAESASASQDDIEEGTMSFDDVDSD